MTNTTRYALCWFRGPLAVAAVLLALLPGCRREMKPPEATAGLTLSAPTDCPVRYEAVLNITELGREPRAVAVDGDRRTYVAGRDGVRVFDASGALARAWATSGPAVAVAVGASGRCYVGLEQKVEVYDEAGRLVDAWGEPGRGEGKLQLVTGLQVDEPELFVADSGNRRVKRFAVNGDFIAVAGEGDKGEGIEEIRLPSPHLDCALSATGDLLLTNPGCRRVDRYTRDGEAVSQLGKAGLSPGRFSGCCNPTNVVSVPGPIPVFATSEKGVVRVQVFGGDGRLLAYLGPELFSEKADGLDLAADDAGRLYVLDAAAEKVIVFARADGGADQ